MKRLKLELKQTMDMYSSACKEAISAKNKAKELTQWKMEEARKFEEARLSEEAALAIAEIEKAKCKAAMEAAAMAQKLAEKEAQRRKQAEKAAKREAEEKNRALTVLSHNDVRYRKYTIEEIEAATDKFADSLKIGEGGYGPVYKGKLDHTPVAIKVLRPDAAQGRKQFQQEVEVLSCIRHPNMVLLLGACSEYGCLVYEYMNNGSLEDRLMRREPLVHRDLKPANILLDRNFVSKISDVGLARLVPQSVADQVTQYHMTSAAGTFCYIDPEYQQTGMLTTKSDIYSFGIMLLQIITGRPQWVLPTMFRVEEALAFAKLALQCTELRKKDRPDLGTVIVPELKRLKDFGKNAGADNVNLGRSGSGHSQNHMHRPPIARVSRSQFEMHISRKRVVFQALIATACTSDQMGQREVLVSMRRNYPLRVFCFIGLLITFATLTYEDHVGEPESGLLCISDCTTCPVICSPPPPVLESHPPPPTSQPVHRSPPRLTTTIPLLPTKTNAVTISATAVPA
ncbi:hypothetical protein FNV43_RR12468 [Rhamnella rubrinervis]|uniref:RING-type E3 ubiquitin transferase n=1 Tax=Rhamnella rubrinervis TaxID=2594499 RepID=A0A8K0H7D4_9ROSA|nr:hypothetical protein FNV43_RR12468 [Rhamnella rubrinervis]